MKIHIIYQFRNGPYGGVNQFLKALKAYFEKQGCYEEKIDLADIVLYNSSNATKEVLLAKSMNQHLMFVQRMDGPSSWYTQKKDDRDDVAAKMNKYVADATVFQTSYSQNANYEVGLFRNTFETTIPNAPDPSIFYKKENGILDKDRKIRLIASSWSSNIHKGFEAYKYLDDNLDFSKYEMIFVGNSPVEFTNIKKMEPLGSDDLAKVLRTCDIYITASKKDPCSNSLIEAMFCGLPVIALRDGGHPELVGEAGELFDDYREIPDLLKKVCENYEQYSDKMILESIEGIGKRYFDFFREIYSYKERKEYRVKKLKANGKILINLLLLKIRIKEKIKRVLKR